MTQVSYTRPGTPAKPIVVKKPAPAPAKKAAQKKFDQKKFNKTRDKVFNLGKTASSTNVYVDTKTNKKVTKPTPPKKVGGPKLAPNLVPYYTP